MPNTVKNGQSVKYESTKKDMGKIYKTESPEVYKLDPEGTNLNKPNNK